MRKTILGLFLLILISGVLALPPTPSAFYGNVQDSDGEDVLEGYITAKLNDVEAGTCQVIDGTYGYGSNSLIVLAYDKIVGKIEFYYGEEKIGEHDFIDMGVTELDFIVESPPPIDDNDNGGNNGGSPGGGGPSGGSPTSECIEEWTCENWGECKDESQSRTCTDINKCGTEKIRPYIERSCNVEGEEDDSGLGFLETTSEEPPNFFSRITGAVIGGGRAKFTIPIIFIVLIIAVAIGVYVKRR